MRKAAIGVVAVVVLIGTSAFAAPPPPAPIPVATWTGCYAGLNAGYGWGRINDDVNYLPSAPFFGQPPLTLSDNPRGALGGAQVGCNYQYGTAWVVGVEADYDFSDIAGTGYAALPAQPGLVLPAARVINNSDIDGIGTVRGRIGWLAAAQWLFYGTGGLAYGRTITSDQFSYVNGVNYLDNGSRVWKTGWTAGGGFEWAFASHWSLKVEYLYVDLGSVGSRATLINANPLFGVTNSYSTSTANIVRAGVNLRF